jgi:hypothetical protein
MKNTLILLLCLTGLALNGSPVVDPASTAHAVPSVRYCYPDTKWVQCGPCPVLVPDGQLQPVNGFKLTTCPCPPPQYECPWEDLCFKDEEGL